MSARNIGGVEVLPASQFNAYTVLRPKRLVLTKAALEELCKNAGMRITESAAGAMHRG